MKRLLMLAIGLVIAYLLYRLLSEFLRPVPVRLDEQPSPFPPYPEPPPPSPPPPAKGPDRVNLNQADTAALTALPGVGPTLAERFVAYREQVGSFESPDDLVNVQGVGPALVKRLRPLVTV